VTKGAIYHHFASKRDLFMAVLERQEEISAASVLKAGMDAPEGWSMVLASVDALLDNMSAPAYQRLCWVEGPAALGFEAWWECGERHEIEMIRTLLGRAAEAGMLAMEDLDMLAHVLFGAVCAGVLAMARSHEPARELERFRSVFLDLMGGLVRPPGP
jgi:AcrR family transcriptional regulator